VPAAPHRMCAAGHRTCVPPYRLAFTYACRPQYTRGNEGTADGVFARWVRISRSAGNRGGGGRLKRRSALLYISTDSNFGRMLHVTFKKEVALAVEVRLGLVLRWALSLQVGCLCVSLALVRSDRHRGLKSHTSRRCLCVLFVSLCVRR
jgi:hypothetical protein